MHDGAGSGQKEIALEAGLQEVASSKLRRLLAQGDSVLFYEAANRNGAPGWRGPAKISDIDETRVTVEFQSRTFKVARNCVRKKVEPQDVEPVEWDSASLQSRMRNEVPRGELQMGKRGAGSDLE